MLLGSHNSFSYGKPIKWWLIPFNFVAKCQAVDIKTQYEKYGVRVFDLRLRDYKGTWYASHGPMLYPIDYDALSYLDDKKDCYIRFCLEYNSQPNNYEDLIRRFRREIYFINYAYPDIKVFDIRTKWNWESIIVYGAQEDLPNYSIALDDKYSSTQKPIYWDDWWPWLYARFNNKKNIAKGTDKDCLFIDFVNIGHEKL